MKKFAGQVVWITGGGTGIGRALAQTFANEGATVVVSGRRKDKLDETVAATPNTHAMVCDVTKRADCFSVVDNIIKQFNKLDVVVANAGFGVIDRFINLTEEEWRRQLDVNVFGVVWTLQAAYPHLRKNKGRAAVVASVAGKVAGPALSAYNASKFALVGLCNSLYVEWHKEVSVTAILPGMIDSEFPHIDKAGKFHAEIDDLRPKNFVMSAQQCAKEAVAAIYKRKRESVITWHGKFGVFFVNHFSGLLYKLIAKVGRHPVWEEMSKTAKSN